MMMIFDVAAWIDGKTLGSICIDLISMTEFPSRLLLEFSIVNHFASKSVDFLDTS